MDWFPPIVPIKVNADSAKQATPGVGRHVPFLAPICRKVLALKAASCFPLHRCALAI